MPYELASICGKYCFQNGSLRVELIYNADLGGATRVVADEGGFGGSGCGRSYGGRWVFVVGFFNRIKISILPSKKVHVCPMLLKI